MNKIPFIALAILSGALCLAAPAENEALYFPNGEFYVPRANLLDNNGNTVRSYALNLRKYSGGWKFKLYGATPLSTSTNAASTNSTSTTNLAGTWAFTFNELYGRTFNGTNFTRNTNAAPVSTNFSLTLSQTNSDVSATGTVNSIQYSLSGEIHDDFFAFDILVGQTNTAINLISVHATIGDGVLEGDYLWSTTGATEVNLGTLTATKQ